MTAAVGHSPYSSKCAGESLPSQQVWAVYAPILFLHSQKSAAPCSALITLSVHDNVPMANLGLAQVLPR